MPSPLRSSPLLLATLLLLNVSSAHAQPRRILSIEKVHIGLPGGPENQRRVRLGAWTPVYVDLKAGKKEDFKEGQNSLSAGEYELLLESSDGDSQGQFVVPAPAMNPEERRTVLTYYRPSDHSGELNLTLRKKDGGSVMSIKQGARSVDAVVDSIVMPGEILYLSLGGSLSGLRDALTPKKKGEEEDPKGVLQAERRMAVITRIADLPNRWLGYQGVDVVVLTTGSTGFVRELTASPTATQALGEWLRRGGRLVLTVGRNYQDARPLLTKLGLTNVTLDKNERVTRVEEFAKWSAEGPQVAPFPGGEGVETARLKLGDGAMPLAVDRAGKDSWPVLSLVTVGTGRVLLVAFDVDSPAFNGWKGQTSFWKKVQDELSPQGASDDPRSVGRSSELATNLQRGLENFDEVPVISFGWVAFFILVYILIVGPLDYWFLKKVVKRMELTWVTFPLVVLVVSVAAYFTAYKLKGNHLRINKVDVVDIHLSDNEVQGTTWLALFSPRVQAYTVGIEPVKEWSGEGADDQRYGKGTVVTPMNTPDSSVGGVDRPASQSLFRRPYQFAEEASGLRGVPVPVWASRSFTASWRRRINPGELIRLDGVAWEKTHLVGKIENRLPVELTEAALFYQGKWFHIGTLPVGPYQLAQATSDSPWLKETFRAVYSPRVAQRQPRDVEGTRGFATTVPGTWSPESTRPSSLMKSLLFHDRERGGAPSSAEANSGLRMLDQGWRLRKVNVADVGERYFDEAVLVGRAVLAPADAEDVSLHGVCPTRVWLGRLPEEGGSRERLPGFLGQDTYVRIYIPVPRSE